MTCRWLVLGGKEGGEPIPEPLSLQQHVSLVSAAVIDDDVAVNTHICDTDQCKIARLERELKRQQDENERLRRQLDLVS